MNVLVTGGAGYIGSHTVQALISHGFKPIVLDNLTRGHREVVEDVLRTPLIIGNAGNKKLVSQILNGTHPATNKNPVDAVIHFAAYAYVGESIEKPATYYRNNTIETFKLLEAIRDEGKARNGQHLPFVFSSSCATYGTPPELNIPISEDCPQRPINPYGTSKLMAEQFIKDFGQAYNMPNVILRYFNAAGADPLGALGENHCPETHLIPLALQAASGMMRCMNIYGDDYQTNDGTCIRDYIHVSDLAEAHVLSLIKLADQPINSIFNLGNSKGYSVFEILKAVQTITGREIPFTINPRRPGDPPILVASAKKAETGIGWTPQYKDIETIIGHAWAWHKKMHSLS